MKRAKGPNNLHSPSSAPGRDVPLAVEFRAAVAKAPAIEAVVEGTMSDAEVGTKIKAISVGSEVEAAARSESGTSSGMDIGAAKGSQA